MHARHKLNDEAFGYLKRVIVTPTVNLRLILLNKFFNLSTEQKSQKVTPNTDSHPFAIFLRNSQTFKYKK